MVRVVCWQNSLAWGSSLVRRLHLGVARPLVPRVEEAWWTVVVDVASNVLSWMRAHFLRNLTEIKGQRRYELRYYYYRMGEFRRRVSCPTTLLFCAVEYYYGRHGWTKWSGVDERCALSKFVPTAQSLSTQTSVITKRGLAVEIFCAIWKQCASSFVSEQEQFADDVRVDCQQKQFHFWRCREGWSITWLDGNLHGQLAHSSCCPPLSPDLSFASLVADIRFLQEPKAEFEMSFELHFCVVLC